MKSQFDLVKIDLQLKDLELSCHCQSCLVCAVSDLGAIADDVFSYSPGVPSIDPAAPSPLVHLSTASTANTECQCQGCFTCGCSALSEVADDVFQAPVAPPSDPTAPTTPLPPSAPTAVPTTLKPASCTRSTRSFVARQVAKCGKKIMSPLPSKKFGKKRSQKQSSHSLSQGSLKQALMDSFVYTSNVLKPKSQHGSDDSL